MATVVSSNLVPGFETIGPAWVENDALAKAEREDPTEVIPPTDRCRDRATSTCRSFTGRLPLLNAENARMSSFGRNNGPACERAGEAVAWTCSPASLGGTGVSTGPPCPKLRILCLRALIRLTVPSAAAVIDPGGKTRGEEGSGRGRPSSNVARRR